MDDDLIILNYYNLIAAVVKRAHLDVELEKNRKRQWNPAEGDCPHLFLADMQQVDMRKVPLKKYYSSHRQLGVSYFSGRQKVRT